MNMYRIACYLLFAMSLTTSWFMGQALIDLNSVMLERDELKARAQYPTVAAPHAPSLDKVELDKKTGDLWLVINRDYTFQLMKVCPPAPYF